MNNSQLLFTVLVTMEMPLAYKLLLIGQGLAKVLLSL